MPSARTYQLDIVEKDANGSRMSKRQRTQGDMPDPTADSPNSSITTSLSLSSSTATNPVPGPAVCIQLQVQDHTLEHCEAVKPNWHPPPCAFESEVVAMLYACCGHPTTWNTKKPVIKEFKASGMWSRWCSAKLNECQLKHFIRRLKRKEITECENDEDVAEENNCANLPVQEEESMLEETPTPSICYRIFDDAEKNDEARKLPDTLIPRTVEETNDLDGVAESQHADHDLCADPAVFSSSDSIFFVLEVDVDNLNVLRMSVGLQALFRYHPRDQSIIGECLLHYVDMSSAEVLRSALQIINKPGSFEINLRTFQNVGIVQSIIFSVQTASNLAWKTAFLFGERRVSSPLGHEHLLSSAPGFGWTVEPIQNLCGIYHEDASRSTQPYWRTVDQLISLHEGHDVDANVNLINMAFSLFASKESSKLAMEAIGIPPDFTPSSNSTTFPDHFKDVITRLVQTHITVDMKNETVPLLHLHVRLKLPKNTGALRTPWVHLMSAELDGTPVPSLSTQSKQMRMYGIPSPNGQLRVLAMLFLKSPTPSEVKSYAPTISTESDCDTQDQDGASTTMQCHHTRELSISSEVSDSPHPPHPPHL